MTPTDDTRPAVQPTGGGSLEGTLLLRMTTDAGMSEVIESGISDDVLLTPKYRYVFTQLLGYQAQYQQTHPVPVLEKFLQGLAVPEDGVESTGWLIEQLSRRYLLNQVRDVVLDQVEEIRDVGAPGVQAVRDSCDEILTAVGSPQAHPFDPVYYAQRLMRHHTEARAKKRFDLDIAGPPAPFDVGLLSEILARPQEAAYRIEELLPSKASLLVAALRKTGKTTMMLNLARVLVTGEKFLDRFAVRPIAGQVGILNYEMAGQQLGHWAAAVGIPDDRLVLANLRGRRNPLSHADDRARLADYLRSHTVESLIVDPFGRAFSGTSQNDAGEVGSFLADLDRFAREEVGAFDVVLTAHMGWSGERVRGASALEDWADSIAYLTTEKGARYFSALGRDVFVDEDRLHFDAETRLLSLTGAGNRQDAEEQLKGSMLRIAVAKIVTDNPGINATKIVAVARELRTQGSLDTPFQNVALRAAINEAADSGAIRREGKGGPGQPCFYFPSDRVQDVSDTV